MSRARLPQLHNIKDGSFEPNKKNAISLGDDSVLSSDSKPIKIGDKSSILELSEDSLIIRGAIEFDTLLRGILTSPNERMAFTAKTGEYRWYSTSNDEDYVRMYVLGGNCLLQAVDASGGTQADISLDAGNDIILDAETGVFKFEKAGDLDDLCTLTVAADGATTIATADSDGAAGHLTLDIDGDLISNPHSGISKFLRGTNADDFFSITVDGNGGGVLATTDDAGTDADLTLRPDGILKAEAEDGGISIKETADAGTDSAGYGQVWIHNTTPNELAFTDDAGTDIVGVGKYHYETKFIGFYAGQTSQYIPMTGYIIEKTSTASNNEFISFVTPYNCTIEKFIYRSEVAQDGNITLTVWESSDGTETPATRHFAKANAVDIADDTFVDLDLTSPDIGSDYSPLTKGKIYAIQVVTPSSGFDTNITVVFKWDITS